MNFLRHIIATARAYFCPAAGSTNENVDPVRPTRARRYHASIAAAANDPVQVPHACYEETLFCRVDESGTVLTGSEEWTREGHSMRTLLRQSRVITEDNAIVEASELGGICIVCNGFIAAPIVRCSVCGGPVCAFHHKNLGESIFCQPHYELALDQLTTWQLLPGRTEKS